MSTCTCNIFVFLLFLGHAVSRTVYWNYTHDTVNGCCSYNSVKIRSDNVDNNGALQDRLEFNFSPFDNRFFLEAYLCASYHQYCSDESIFRGWIASLHEFSLADVLNNKFSNPVYSYTFPGWSSWSYTKTTEDTTRFKMSSSDGVFQLFVDLQVNEDELLYPKVKFGIQLKDYPWHGDNVLALYVTLGTKGYSTTYVKTADDMLVVNSSVTWYGKPVQWGLQWEPTVTADNQTVPVFFSGTPIDQAYSSVYYVFGNTTTQYREIVWDPYVGMIVSENNDVTTATSSTSGTTSSMGTTGTTGVLQTTGTTSEQTTGQPASTSMGAHISLYPAIIVTFHIVVTLAMLQ